MWSGFIEKPCGLVWSWCGVWCVAVCGVVVCGSVWCGSVWCGSGGVWWWCGSVWCGVAGATVLLPHKLTGGTHVGCQRL